MQRQSFCLYRQLSMLHLPPYKTQRKLKRIVSKYLHYCTRSYKLASTNTKSISPCLQLLIRPVGAGCIFSVLCLRRHILAKCDDRTASPQTRLVGLETRSKSLEPSFNWREFVKLLWPEFWYLIAAVASAVAAALINIQIPLNMGELVNVISGFTRESAHHFLQDVKEPALRLITLYGIQSLLTFTYITLLGSLGERIAARLRMQLFSALMQQDIEFYDSHKTGELIDRLTSDIQDFKSSFKLCISQGLRAFTQTAGCIGTLLMISPKLTGIMLVVVPLIISAGSLLGHSLRKLSRAAQAQVALATAVADEAIGNVRTVRAFAMEQKEHELYSREVEQSANLNMRLSVGIGAFQGLANMALNGIVLGVLFAGGSMMASGELTAGNLMSFLMATQTIERSLAHMSMLFGQVIRGTSAGARVFEFATLKPKVPLEGGERIPVDSFIGNIEFKNVSFSYPTRPEQEVLHDFSLCVPGGKVVALVGLSGGGKSTIAALLERFYEVSDGEISIDGHSLTSLDPTWLRGRAIGFINQEPVLFATTVRENIRYGYPEASDEQILEASKLANAHDFISQFPQGYDTVLGERGVTVSGGQKQRIAIARALIKNPSILILDEATSALDAESERIVQEALDKVIHGHTVLIIAHRLSTIKDADLIAVVSNGKIVEMGQHDELRRRRGLYWELIKQQHVEEEIEGCQKRYFGL